MPLLILHFLITVANTLDSNIFYLILNLKFKIFCLNN